MAFLGNTFDANNVEPNTPSEIIPAGKYLMQIVNSEMRETKKGGQMLWLELAIQDGQFANRRCFDRLNLINDNPKAVEIAQRSLSAICRAVGKMTVSDSEMLHHISMLVTVKVKAAEGQYGPQNEIGGYEAASGQRSAPAAVQQTAPAASAPASAPKPAASTPPWRRTA